MGGNAGEVALGGGEQILALAGALGGESAVAAGRSPGYRNPRANEYRSREVMREFQYEHPCASTGLRFGACPGYRARVSPRLQPGVRWLAQNIPNARAQSG
jgi:hypothetical protein